LAAVAFGLRPGDLQPVLALLGHAGVIEAALASRQAFDRLGVDVQVSGVDHAQQEPYVLRGRAAVVPLQELLVGRRRQRVIRLRGQLESGDTIPISA